MNNDTAYKMSVREVQNSLYLMSQTNPLIQRVNPDGIYGKETAEAVKSFQKYAGIAVTGKVDFETWKLLMDCKNDAVICLSEPKAISPFTAVLKNGIIAVGDQSDTAHILSIMMHTLGIAYPCFEDLSVSNTFGEKESEAITSFQHIHGIGETGIVDKLTWNRLAEAYCKHVKNNE